MHLKLYLQQETRRRIPDDDEDQSHAPVVGNTHNLREGRKRKHTQCVRIHSEAHPSVHLQRPGLKTEPSREKKYLQEVVDGRKRDEHNEEEENVESRGGQQERP